MSKTARIHSDFEIEIMRQVVISSNILFVVRTDSTQPLPTKEIELLSGDQAGSLPVAIKTGNEPS